MEPTYKKIYSKFQLSPAYHMTHLKNFKSILKEGGVWCLHSLMKRGLFHEDLSSKDVQSTRAKRVIKANGKSIHEYVPLFFGLKPPMVATVQEINEEIIFLRVSLDIFERVQGCFVADGNATSQNTRFKEFRSIEDLGVLNVGAIHTLKFSHDLELKRQKQSELLVPIKLPLTEVFEIIVFSDISKKFLLKSIANSGTDFAPKVSIRGRLWYYE